MLCQICKEHEATIHLTEISSGKRTEMHLCQACAVEQGVASKSHMSLNDILSNLLASAPEDDQMLAGSEKLKCPCCGYTLEQFRKETLLGCPDDYEVFGKELMPLIEKAHHGNSSHCGKIPAGAPDDTRKQTELLSLKQRLDKAVKTEDYETAAKLRDQIKDIEQ